MASSTYVPHQPGWAQSGIQGVKVSSLGLEGRFVSFGPSQFSKGGKKKEEEIAFVFYFLPWGHGTKNKKESLFLGCAKLVLLLTLMNITFGWFASFKLRPHGLTHLSQSKQINHTQIIIMLCLWVGGRAYASRSYGCHEVVIYSNLGGYLHRAESIGGAVQLCSSLRVISVLFLNYCGSQIRMNNLRRLLINCSLFL